MPDTGKHHIILCWKSTAQDESLIISNGTNETPERVLELVENEYRDWYGGLLWAKMLKVSDGSILLSWPET